MRLHQTIEIPKRGAASVRHRRVVVRVERSGRTVAVTFAQAHLELLQIRKQCGTLFRKDLAIEVHTVR